MNATRIAPTPTRTHFVDAVTAAERMVAAAAITQNEGLMHAARHVEMAAWEVLQDFDGVDPR